MILLPLNEVFASEVPLNADLAGEILDSRVKILSQKDGDNSATAKLVNLFERKDNKYILTYTNWFRCSYKIGSVSFRKQKDKYVLKMNIKRKWGFLNSCEDRQVVKFQIAYMMPRGSVLEVIGDYDEKMKFVVP